MSIHLRPATLDDAATLADVIRRSFAEYEGRFDPPSGALSETAEKVASKLALGGGILAFAQDDLLGCVLYERRESYMYLGRLAVLPHHRRRGAARVLVTAVEDRAREAGLDRVQLGVRVGLPQNRAFFESLGYRLLGYGSHPGKTEATFMTLEKVL